MLLPHSSWQMLDNLNLNLTRWTINSNLLSFLYFSIEHYLLLWLWIYLELFFDWNGWLFAGSNFEGWTLNGIFDLKCEVDLLFSFSKSKAISVDLYRTEFVWKFYLFDVDDSPLFVIRRLDQSDSPLSLIDGESRYFFKGRVLDWEWEILEVGDQIFFLDPIEFGEILSVDTYSSNLHVTLWLLSQPENLNDKERIDWRILTI